MVQMYTSIGAWQKETSIRAIWVRIWIKRKEKAAYLHQYLPLLFRGKLQHPLNPVFIAEHAEIGAPGTVRHGYFHLSAF